MPLRAAQVHIHIEIREGDRLALGVLGGWLSRRLDCGLRRRLGCGKAGLRRDLTIFVCRAREDDLTLGLLILLGWLRCGVWGRR